MQNKNTLILLFIAILFKLASSQQPKECPQNCQSCFKSGPFYCDACADGYERSNQGSCIPETSVDNCMVYGPRNTCFECKPSYRLFLNICVKMYDGCLENPTGKICKKCLDGAYLNSFGFCDTKYLNCLQVSNLGKCKQCISGYQVQSGTGKCVDANPNCKKVEIKSGLCLECNGGFIMVGYQCVEIEKRIKNCYLVSETLQDCIYCKPGYEILYGQCSTPDIIKILIQGPQSQISCNQNQYYNPSTQTCNSNPSLCLKMDHGLLRCSYCWPANILIGGLCREPTLRFCQKFLANNPYKCQKCFQKFQNVDNGSVCIPYPPFCDQMINRRCIICISPFLLNKQGFCEDPNCFSTYSNSFECQYCKYSYQKNKDTGICTFRDLNCLEEKEDRTCKICKVNYQIDPMKGTCKFVDPDCKVFSDNGKCHQCKQGFYLSEQKNLCIKNPYKCVTVNEFGQCQLCADGYALVTNYQCQPIERSNSCEIASEINPKTCKKCKMGYYRNIDGLCNQNPVLCVQFNITSSRCIQCEPNSKMYDDGYCYDNNCEVFGPQGQCYGCKSQYDFGPRGECIKKKIDANCQQFAYGQCKTCSNGYFFNKNWECERVSVQCRTYNPNNGKCVTCYPGYIIIGNSGTCVHENMQNICIRATNKSGNTGENKNCAGCLSGYVLINGSCYNYEEGCEQRKFQSNTDLNNPCIKCRPQYRLESNFSVCIPDIDQNCLIKSELDASCKQCIKYTYYNEKTKKCTPVDPNCKDYNQITGSCEYCFDGYVTTLPDSDGIKKCRKAQPQDPNCKIFGNVDNQEPQCLQCYKGYYYSTQQKACTLLNQLCKDSNFSNGDCISCWEGYDLINGKCVILNTAIKIEDGSISVQDPMTAKDVKCEKFDEKGKCIECIFGAVLEKDTNICQFPLYNFDQNCQQYRDKICVKCTQDYRLEAHQCLINN